MIGILDWGIGGCGFYDKLKQHGDISTIYLSDSGFMPYGKVPKMELQDRVYKAITFLFDRGADKVVVACNSASSVVTESDNVTGILRHTIKCIEDSKHRFIGVIGGRRTVMSHQLSVNKFDGKRIRQRIAQKLSAHIEAGIPDKPAMEKDLKTILSPLKKCDALILACTHYPAVTNNIKKQLNSGCQIIDPVEEMLRWVINNWKSNQAKQPHNQWFTTGDSFQTSKSAHLAFNVHISNIEKIEL